MHTVFALLFVLAGAFHIWISRRTFWSYVPHAELLTLERPHDPIPAGARWSKLRT